MPRSLVDSMIDMARRANQEATTAPDDVAELVAVRATVAAHATSIPQNIFTPFAIHHPAATYTHWGNVDTGSMVNIVYMGVVDRFPFLRYYWKPTNLTVEGVGGKKSQVLGKLVDVPISLGLRCAPAPCALATFYVLDSPDYHFILGLTFLNAVDGIVKCRDQELAFTNHASREQRVKLVPRTEAILQPVFGAFGRDYRMAKATDLAERAIEGKGENTGEDRGVMV